MIPFRESIRPCPGDVLIHPTRGGAVVDRAMGDGYWVELAERLDRSRSLISEREASDTWRLAAAGGLFEASVLHHNDAMNRVSDRPTDCLAQICDELATPVHPELAATWLVSRGLLAPGRAIAWWSDATAGLAEHPELQMLEDGKVTLVPSSAPPLESAHSMSNDALLALGARARQEVLATMSPQARARRLAEAVDLGRVDLVMLLLRGIPSDAVPPALERLLASGNRDLMLRCAAAAPALVAAEIVSQLRANPAAPSLGDVLANLPLFQRAALYMEMLNASLDDPDVLDVIEGHLAETWSVGELLALVEPSGGNAGFCTIQESRRWAQAILWLSGRNSDSTMEMPSLLPNPLLREVDQLSAREIWPVTIALARSLARRHARGRFGGLDSARLHRAEHRIELGNPEQGHARRDVQEGMAVMLHLAVGSNRRTRALLDSTMGVASAATLLAHAATLAPTLAPEWLAVCSQAIAKGDHGPVLADGLALWLALERAMAVARVREQYSDPGRPNIDIGFDTHIGAAKARLGQTNQDALFFHSHDGLTLLVVADGISTSTAGSGNLASAIFIQTIAAAWERDAELLAGGTEDELTAFLRQSLEDANTAICTAAVELAGGDLDGQIPMGTTALVALVRRGRVVLASLGDSRAYLVGLAGVAQLTGDGNLRGEWLKARSAAMPEEHEADAAALTAYLGHFNRTGSPEALPPHVRAFTLLPGETLLLCSDGLTDFAATEPAEFAALVERSLAGSASLSVAARALVAAANAGGGGDNITVLMATTTG